MHEQARLAFDAQGAALKHQVGPMSISANKPVWRPNVHTTSVPLADVLRPQGSRTAGPNPQRANVVAGKGRGLTGQAAEDFDELIGAFHRAIRPKEAVSRGAVETAAEEWLFDVADSVTFTSHCMAVLARVVREMVVFVPVHGLCVEEPLRVGSVMFEELSAARIEHWHKTPAYDRLAAEERPHVDAHFARFSKSHRGRAIAIVEAVAEKTQAIALALARVEAAIGVLRFFSGTALVPSLRSVCVPFGREPAYFQSQCPSTSGQSARLDACR
jgi:hypothetical protein